MIPQFFHTTETAIEQAHGLVEILAFVHSNADAVDRGQLHQAMGWLLLSISDTLQVARGGMDRVYQHHFEQSRAIQ